MAVEWVGVTSDSGATSNPGTKLRRAVGLLAALAATTATALASANARRGISETDESFKLLGQEILVDVYKPDAPGKYPAIIVVHGAGGVGEGKQYNCHDGARRLARAGYVAILPHYFGRAVPDRKNGQKNSRSYQAWVQTVGATVAYTARRADVDSEQIGILGFSLGSWVALSVAAREPRLSAVVEHYGGLPEFDPRDWSSLPPVLILHGDKDTNVNVREAHKLDRALTQAAVPHEVKIFAGAGHGFRDEVLEDASARTIAFFDKRLKRDRTGADR
jgi:carboxymethylenebutenolidase